jgi:hypothetical protein
LGVPAVTGKPKGFLFTDMEKYFKVPYELPNDPIFVLCWYESKSRFEVLLYSIQSDCWLNQDFIKVDPPDYFTLLPQRPNNHV